MSNEQQPEEPTTNSHTDLAPHVPSSTDHGAEVNSEGHAQSVPNKDDILRRLDRMPGLIAIGVLPPAKANAMKGVYNTILSHLDDSSQSGRPRIADGNLIQILQMQPELLTVLQPFLTPDQLELIIREAPK